MLQAGSSVIREGAYSHSAAVPTKLSLQLYPASDDVRSAVCHSNNNPLLELTFKSTKSVRAILKHLSNKWQIFAHPHKALRLLPYADIKGETISWSLLDAQDTTAADDQDSQAAPSTSQPQAASLASTVIAPSTVSPRRWHDASPKRLLDAVAGTSIQFREESNDAFSHHHLGSIAITHPEAGSLLQLEPPGSNAVTPCKASPTPADKDLQLGPPSTDVTPLKPFQPTTATPGKGQSSILPSPFKNLDSMSILFAEVRAQRAELQTQTPTKGSAGGVFDSENACDGFAFQHVSQAETRSQNLHHQQQATVEEQTTATRWASDLFLGAAAGVHRGDGRSMAAPSILDSRMSLPDLENSNWSLGATVVAAAMADRQAEPQLQHKGGSMAGEPLAKSLVPLTAENELSLGADTLLTLLNDNSVGDVRGPSTSQPTITAPTSQKVGVARRPLRALFHPLPGQVTGEECTASPIKPPPPVPAQQPMRQPSPPLNSSISTTQASQAKVAPVNKTTAAPKAPKAPARKPQASGNRKRSASQASAATLDGVEVGLANKALAVAMGGTQPRFMSLAKK
eukprot:jgi/Chlat1/9264/Chrsp99S08531